MYEVLRGPSGRVGQPAAVLELVDEVAYWASWEFADDGPLGAEIEGPDAVLWGPGEAPWTLHDCPAIADGRLVLHSYFCPTCGQRATDAW